MLTIHTHTTPARTPSASHVANVVALMLQISIAVTRTITRRMAGIGVCVRSFTSANFSGSNRSKAQANTVRTGMNVLPTIAGRLQNRNDPTINTVSSLTLNASDARKWYQGPVGMTYALLPARFTAAMKA